MTTQINVKPDLISRERTSPGILRFIAGPGVNLLTTICVNSLRVAVDAVEGDEITTLGLDKRLRVAIYQSIRSLKREESSIARRFVSELLRRSQTLAERPSTATTVSSKFALMDEDQLEREVLCSTLCASALSACSEELASLGKVLKGEVIAADGENQFSGRGLAQMEKSQEMSARMAIGIEPRQLLDAFMLALESQHLEPETTISLLKAFHDQLKCNLPRFYKEARTFLLQASEVRSAGHRNEAGFRVEQVGKTSQEGSYNAALQPQTLDSGASSHALSAILQLLVGRQPATRTAARVYTLEELDLVVQELQRHALVNQPDGKHCGALDKSVTSALAEMVGDAHLEEAHRATIDLVELIFEFALQDAAVSEAAISDLRRLRPLILRLVLRDRQVLLTKESAGRRLFDASVRMGGRQSSAAAKTQLEAVINSALRASPTDIDWLSEVIAEVERVNVSPVSRSAAEKRAIDSANAKERRLEAWREVSQLAFDRMESVIVPSAVKQFIYRPWAQYMVLLRLRGCTEYLWNDACEVLRRLPAAFCTEQASCTSAARTPSQLLASCAASVRNGVALVGYSTQDIVYLWRSFTDLLLNKEGATERSESAVRPIGDDIATAMLDKSNGPYTEDAIPERSESIDAGPRALLPIGTYVTFVRNGTEPLRLKLCWRGSSTGVHVFVNRSGAKALEISTRAVADMIKDGSMIVCAHDSVVDRAVHRILGKLNAEKA
jgi:hypothetical protein